MSGRSQLFGWNKILKSGVGAWEKLLSTAGANHVADIGRAAQPHNRGIEGVGSVRGALGHRKWSEAEGVYKIRFKTLGGSAGDIIRVVFDASPVADITNDNQAWNWLQPFSASEMQIDGGMAIADTTGTGTTNPGWSWDTNGWNINTGVSGKAVTESDDGILTSATIAASGVKYLITYTLAVADMDSIVCGGVTLTGVTAGATYNEIIEATSATSLFVATALATHASATIDNVSITNLDEAADVDVEYFEFQQGIAGADMWSGWYQFSSPLRRADFLAVDESSSTFPTTTILVEVG